MTLEVAEALTAAGVAYALVGSFASNYYGIPRSTKDADFVIQLATGVGEDFARRLGDEFQVDPQLSFETVTGTHRQLVRNRKRRFKIELFILSADEHDQQRFARRQEVSLFGRKVWLLSPEDVIVSKLRWARGKDEDDIRNVITVQGARLDWRYVETWCKRHDTLALLEKIRQSVPTI
jgi:predicted nucleotidyltransferase